MIIKSAISFFTDIKDYARCYKDHKEVFFQKFTNPPDDWDYFGVCPDLDEPIFMKIEHIPDAAKGVQ